MKQWCFAFVLCSSVVLAQNSKQFIHRENSFAVFGGMSVNAVAAADIVDYINSVSTYAQRVDNFASAVDFFGGVEFPVGNEWGLKVEHTYLFKSYNFLGNSGSAYNFFYSVQAPSILIQKVITGEGFFVKLGAGGGYHFGSATQTISTYGTSSEYTAKGIGIKGEIVGQTGFDENFFGYISGHLGWEFLGDLKETSTGKILTQPDNATKTVNLNYFFAGIRFGVIYYF